MSHGNFVHLRVHSPYSLAEGAIRIHELADLCVKDKMPAVAITDTFNLFGALEFSEITRTAGIQPIIGCQGALQNPIKDLPDIQTTTQASLFYWCKMRSVIKIFLRSLQILIYPPDLAITSISV